MKLASDDDILELQKATMRAVKELCTGAKRIDITPMDGVVVSGYWVVDNIRIDIKEGKSGSHGTD